MRSFTLALVSALLLSPISVLATYGEHGHHPDHPDHPDHSDHSEKLHQSISKASHEPVNKLVRIAVQVDFLEADVNHACQREEELCLDRHDCHDKSESCGKKHKCHDKKKKCYKEYDCKKDKKICHRKTTNRYGFRCGNKFYNQSKILAAATAACKKIGKNPQNSVFPAIHSTFKFDKDGPYFEWPINKNGRFYTKLTKSKRRLVLTADCAVVGAVVRHKHGDYSKCKYERQ